MDDIDADGPASIPQEAGSRWPADCRLRLHDIRNVAAGLGLVAEALCAANDKRFARLGRRVERMQARIDALTRSGPDSRCPGRAAAPEAGGLAAVLDDVADIVAGAAAPGTRVHVRCEEGLGCPGDADALFRILVNLAANAVAAVGRAGGGEVHLAARAIDEVLFIDVSDDGPGLRDAGGGARSEGSRKLGSGLGLVVAQTLTERLGGRLRGVESSPAGTTLQLSFLAAAAVPRPKAVAGSATPIPA